MDEECSDRVLLPLAVAMLSELALTRKSMSTTAVKSIAEDLYAAIVGMRGVESHIIDEQRSLLVSYYVIIICVNTHHCYF